VTSGGSFEEAINELAEQSGWQRAVTPDSAIVRWENFGEDLRSGYPWDVEDYLEDVQLRSALNKLFRVLGESHQESVRSLEQKILRIDAQIGKVLANETFTRFPSSEWWMRNSPAYASRPFCREFQECYGVTIPERSDLDSVCAEMTRMLNSGATASRICLEMSTHPYFLGRRHVLLYRASKEIFPLDRRKRHALWSWISGNLTDEDFIEKFDD
jgi:hypothetical protein